MNTKSEGLQPYPHMTGRPCAVCALEPHCLHWSVGPLERAMLDSIMERPEPFPDGHHLFRAGDELRNLYAVRYGLFKTYGADGQGRERVVSFSLPGELLGVDGIQRHRHLYNGTTRGESAACILPYDRLIVLMADVPELRHQIMRIVSHHNLVNHPLAERPAEERVAGFLLDVSRRLGRDTEPVLAFELPLSVQDIASYLRLAPEELEDTFVEFSDTRLIGAAGRRMSLLDVDSLRRIAGSLGG